MSSRARDEFVEENVLLLSDNREVLEELRGFGISVMIKYVDGYRSQLVFEGRHELSYLGDDLRLASYLDGIVAGMKLARLM